MDHLERSIFNSRNNIFCRIILNWKIGHHVNTMRWVTDHHEDNQTGYDWINKDILMEAQPQKKQK